LCLLLGAVLWVAFSLLFHPVAGAGSELGVVELAPNRANDSHSTASAENADRPREEPPAVQAPGAPGTGSAPGASPPSPENRAAAAPPGSDTGSTPADDAAEAPGPGNDAAAPSANIAAGDTPGHLVVHVAGAVKKPGVYAFPPGTRANTAVHRAGGLLAGADASAVNLAAALADGQQLYIPTRGESEGDRAGAHDGDATARGGTPAVPGSAAGDAGTGAPVDVNAATDAELQELPGIGPALAGRILEFRASNGPFASLAELDAVSGIGPAMLAKLEPHLVFR
jgi:competence protein ComEA